jgi:hypothetical protein
VLDVGSEEKIVVTTKKGISMVVWEESSWKFPMIEA